jgi:vacuolar-type H+-ATPase subunit I/STV1
MSTIFEIDDQYCKLLAKLEMIDIDDPQYDDQVKQILVSMENIDEAKERKIENYAKIIEQLESYIHSRELTIKKITQAKKTFENQVNRLKQTVVDFMGMWNISKVIGDALTISLRKSTRLDIVDENKIPDKYKKQELIVKIDKAQIKKDLKECDIDGVKLIENKNLQIRG